MEGAHTEPCLIETMRLENGRVALWPWHRARLLGSASALGYPVNEGKLDALLKKAIHAQDRVLPKSTPDAIVYRLRLLLAHDGAISIGTSVQATTQEPVRVMFAQQPLDPAEPLLQHKTTYRPWFEGAEQWLQKHPDIFDLVFANASGALCEGSRCNIYVCDGDGQWLTPPSSCGLLPGVYRQSLLDCGLVREASLRFTDIEDATALRVSNALRGWLTAKLW